MRAITWGRISMKALLAFAFAAGFSTTALSTPVTVNFDDGKLHGFTFFSECTDGYQPGGGFIFGPNESNFITTRICPHDEDGGHLGDPTLQIFREDGRRFTFLGFDLLGSVSVLSSRGGQESVIFLGETGGTHDFFGLRWRNVEWIDICAACGFGGEHDQASLDNFRFDIRRVPEPETWLLVMFGLALALSMTKASTTEWTCHAVSAPSRSKPSAAPSRSKALTVAPNTFIDGRHRHHRGESAQLL
jgi:hypothetical protein